MTISDLSQIQGRRYPARRRTQNLVGGAAPIQATNFSMGNVTLDPNGGQVPWHNQEQEGQPQSALDGARVTPASCRECKSHFLTYVRNMLR